MNATAAPPGLAARIRAWGAELGFGAVAIAGTDLAPEEARLIDWLARGRHGDMDYMARHGTARSRPAELVPGTVSVITARLDYWPAAARDAVDTLGRPELGYVSRYATGRDYHKVMRARLQALVERITGEIGEFPHRVFADSAPVMEVALAARAGLGWRGKHTLLLTREAGSTFFLGEIYTGLALEPDAPVGEHCGTCAKCLAACPTGAIVAPYELDARLCISYLTIEHKGSIPEDLRPMMGNRIYGCDDCQLACPWNKWARPASLPDFVEVRNGLDGASLASLFAWTEGEFDERLAGSAIRRIGHERWLRNIAVALGNAPSSEASRTALAARAEHPSALVREHVAWALARQEKGSESFPRKRL